MIYLMFMVGLVPVFLAFFIISYFIGSVAKKRGKNQWLWGTASFLLLAAISWKQMPSWAAYIYYKGTVAMQAAIPKEPVITIAEAKKINIHSSVDGVHFDMPLAYNFRGFNQKAKGWLGASKGQIEGTERPAVDFINMVALFPDMAPMSEGNLAEFEVLGNGKKVTVAVTHIRSWSYYFKNTFPRTEQQPGSPAVPGMLHYYDPLARDDLYFSHAYDTPDLTRITCGDQKYEHAVSPDCKVETSYRPAPDLVASEHIEGAIFRVEYYFSTQYLSHWREIDQKLKSLFDQFIRNAAQHSVSRQYMEKQ